MVKDESDFEAAARKFKSSLEELELARKRHLQFLKEDVEFHTELMRTSLKNTILHCEEKIQLEEFIANKRGVEHQTGQLREELAKAHQELEAFEARYPTPDP